MLRKFTSIGCKNNIFIFHFIFQFSKFNIRKNELFVMISIWKKIKEFREKNNFSQEYVASKLGMSQQAYQKIESGSTTITFKFILEISKFYKVSCHEFISNEDTELQKLFEQKNKEIEELKNKIKALEKKYANE